MWKEEPKVVYEHDTTRALGLLDRDASCWCCCDRPPLDKMWGLAGQDRRI